MVRTSGQSGRRCDDDVPDLCLADRGQFSARLPIRTLQTFAWRRPRSAGSVAHDSVRSPRRPPCVLASLGFRALSGAPPLALGLAELRALNERWSGVVLFGALQSPRGAGLDVTPNG